MLDTAKGLGLEDGFRYPIELTQEEYEKIKDHKATVFEVLDTNIFQVLDENKQFTGKHVMYVLFTKD